MATLKLSPANSWWGTGSGSAWTNDTSIWSGTPSQGGNYRTKVSFTIPSDTVISKSTKLVVSVKLGAQGYPAGCMGVLSTNGSLDANDIQNSNATGPSDALSTSALATSKACNSSGTALSTGWIDSGTTLYFFFSTTQIKAGKTYYVYLIRTLTTSSWVQSTRSNVSAVFTYESYTACTAPTSFTVSPLVFEDSLTLTWSGASGGTNNKISDYEIQYTSSPDNATWVNWAALTTISASPYNNLSATGVRGRYYKYRIRTRGAAGSSYYSGWKESNSVRKNSIPVAPTSFTVDKSVYSKGDKLSLAWSGARDANSNIDSYVIQYRVQSGGTWGSWQELTTITSSALSGKYEFVPTQAGYQEYLQFRIKVVDKLEVSSDWVTSDTVYRNDTPLVSIKGDTSIGSHAVNLYNGAKWGYFMPYIYDGSSWIRQSKLGR